MDEQEFRWVFLPYCIDRQPDGRYAVLNRRYKPVGMTVTSFVTYTEYPCLVKFKDLTEEVATQVSAKGDARLDRIYLYNDACVPTHSQADWDAYSRRLHLLATLMIVS